MDTYWRAAWTYVQAIRVYYLDIKLSDASRFRGDRETSCTWVCASSFVTAVLAISHAVTLLHRADVATSVATAHRVVGAAIVHRRPQRAFVAFLSVPVLRGLGGRHRHLKEYRYLCDALMRLTYRWDERGECYQAVVSQTSTNYKQRIEKKMVAEGWPSGGPRSHSYVKVRASCSGDMGGIDGELVGGLGIVSTSLEVINEEIFRWQLEVRLVNPV